MSKYPEVEMQVDDRGVRYTTISNQKFVVVVDVFGRDNITTKRAASDRAKKNSRCIMVNMKNSTGGRVWIGPEKEVYRMRDEYEQRRPLPVVTCILGMHCYEKDGIAYLNLEDTARGLGFTTVAASGNVVVRWNTVHKYLMDFGVATSCNGDYQANCPDYIPENIFYRLAMKAKNDPKTWKNSGSFLFVHTRRKKMEREILFHLLSL